MKKFLSLFVVAALLLPVLAGCANTPPANTPPGNATQGNQAAPGNEAAPASADDLSAQIPAADPDVKYISRDDAIAIALKDADLTRDQVRDLEAELDRDDGTVHYDVDFEKDNKEYDYEIDAVTGAILRRQVPKATTSSSSSSSSSSSEKKLTKTEARNIALKHAGLSVSDVRELEVELDRDDGTLHYDVDFESGGYDYDYEIDAVSGKILKNQKERD